MLMLCLLQLGELLGKGPFFDEPVFNIPKDSEKKLQFSLQTYGLEVLMKTTAFALQAKI